MSYHPADRPMSGRDGSMPDRDGEYERRKQVETPGEKESYQGFPRKDRNRSPVIIVVLLLVAILMALL